MPAIEDRVTHGGHIVSNHAELFHMPMIWIVYAGNWIVTHIMQLSIVLHIDGEIGFLNDIAEYIDAGDLVQYMLLAFWLRRR